MWYLQTNHQAAGFDDKLANELEDMWQYVVWYVTDILVSIDLANVKFNGRIPVRFIITSS